MKKFNYCMNHKADEAYMEKMCREGWAATRLLEGVWSFEPCKPGQYTFRVCYPRGMNNDEIEKLKKDLAKRGIEFVSRYSFWVIFRSERDFQLYTPEEELAIIEKIRRPMLSGSVLSWIGFTAFLLLAIKVSAWFCIPTVLIGIYAAVCTCLGISYGRLIKRLEKKE